MDKRVKNFLRTERNWQEEMQLLREIVMTCDVEEDFKWMHPCYTLKGKNVVLIHGFKDYCALLFHKGVLLKDKKKLLVQQTKNVQEGRQLRFSNLEEIKGQSQIIISYIREAIENERAGKTIKLKKTSDYDVPEELVQEFDQDSKFKIAFEALTPVICFMSVESCNDNSFGKRRAAGLLTCQAHGFHPLNIIFWKA